jgi:hypothetical protein
MLSEIKMGLFIGLGIVLVTWLLSRFAGGGPAAGAG